MTRRAPSAGVTEQLLLELPELEVTETTSPTDSIELLQLGPIDTSAWPVDVAVTRRRLRDEGRHIHLTFAPKETPGDWWSVRLSPDQARHAAAMLVAAARAAEEVPDHA